MQALDDDALRAKTAEFRARLDEGATLGQLLPRPSRWWRGGCSCLGMRHFDVQLIGGMAFHDGKIAEMRPARAKRHTACVSQCAARSQRPSGDGE